MVSDDGLVIYTVGDLMCASWDREIWSSVMRLVSRCFRDPDAVIVDLDTIGDAVIGDLGVVDTWYKWIDQRLVIDETPT